MTTVLERLKRASEARGRYVATGEVVYEGAAGTQSVEQVREAMSKLTPGTLYLIMSGGKSDSDYMSREAYIKATMCLNMWTRLLASFQSFSVKIFN